jgi:hypothetical protein
MCWSRKYKSLLVTGEIKLTVTQFTSNGINMYYVTHCVEQSSCKEADCHSAAHEITLFAAAHC